MLYLVRKIGESIIINNNIEVKVVEVKGKSVKLGFEFPADVSVLRQEVHQKILEQNIAASRGAQADDLADALAKLTLSKKPDESDKE